MAILLDFNTVPFSLFSLLIFANLCCVALAAPVPVASKLCDYNTFSKQSHEPLSLGKRQLPSQRPPKECRTFISLEVEEAVIKLGGIIQDPDLLRLFENSFPNTLDTAVKWKGYAKDQDGRWTDEELAFIITGDIDAMWLRDSANQILSYQSLLRASESEKSLASLYRGVINAHSRYIKISPYCHAFQPPIESEIRPATNGAYSQNKLKRPYNRELTFDCKWELDSLASFLELSVVYFEATGDSSPFIRPSYLQTINVILESVEGMRSTTYKADGHVDDSPYTFEGWTNRATETHSNNGLGNPTQSGTGLIRTFFRPSDDATIFQFHVPSNIMFAHYLSLAADLLSKLSPDLPPESVANISQTISHMRLLSTEINNGVKRHAIVPHPTNPIEQIYAYEIDGYGSVNLMDDANLPSLLSLPLYSNIADINDPVYLSTRSFALGSSNPYWSWGPQISAIGGPHNGPGRAWPLASIVRVLTSNDTEEIKGQLSMLLDSTAGLGLVHESVHTFNENAWSRQWFGWANGMFGQMILWLEESRPELLRGSFQ